MEDETRIAGFVTKGLRDNAFAVNVAETGEDALYQAEINTYYAIILDVMIPEKDGFEVCRELREKGSQIPILMLTARDAIEDRIEGLDIGADDYLTKPFAFGELPTRIMVADLEIDMKAQRAWRNAEEIHLTTKEFAELEYLARNAGKVI